MYMKKEVPILDSYYMKNGQRTKNILHKIIKISLSQGRGGKQKYGDMMIRQKKSFYKSNPWKINKNQYSSNHINNKRVSNDYYNLIKILFYNICAINLAFLFIIIKSIKDYGGRVLVNWRQIKHLETHTLTDGPSFIDVLALINAQFFINHYGSIVHYFTYFQALVDFWASINGPSFTEDGTDCLDLEH